MKKRNLLIWSSVLAFSLVLSGCNNNSGNGDFPGFGSDGGSSDFDNPYFDKTNTTTDSEAYNAALPEYNNLMTEADNGSSAAERYAKYAKAEAYLLDQAVLMPTTTDGGSKSISRIVPRTVPYARYGSDNYKFKGMKIVNNLIKKEDRDAVIAQWEADRLLASEGRYDEIVGDDKLLTDLGYTFQYNYNGGSLVQPNTLDYLATSYAQDAEIHANLIDGLVEHDRYGQIVPGIAESWEVSEDGKVYTFKIRNNAKWVRADGTFVANLDAQDYVDGFQHMLDAGGGTEKIVREMVVGVADYLSGAETTMEKVGVAAFDENTDGVAETLKITLIKPAEYFLSVLTFNAFLPINKEFFESMGGKLGLAEFKEAKSSRKYDYGRVSNVNSILYCGAYRLEELTLDQKIVYVKNASYWDAEKVTLERVVQAATIANNPSLFLEEVIAGQYVGCGLSNQTLPQAEAHPYASQCIYTSDNDSITYYTVFNLNRKTYGIDRGTSGAMVSQKTQKEREDTRKAILNKNFRKAVLHAFDKIAYNSPASLNEETASITLRNMYVAPDFLNLPDAYGDYAKNTPYSKIVQDELKALNSPIKVDDGQDGWYNVEYAQECLNKAIEELGDSVSWPIKIDVLYIAAADVSKAMLTAVKKSIQDALTRDRVIIEMVNCDSENDYLISSFLISEGSEANYDLYYGSGWGPDYADPKTYLDTVLPDGRGYSTKTLGLW